MRRVVDFAVVFAIVLVVNAAVVWSYNLIVHGRGAFEWDEAFYFAFTLGIVFALFDLPGRRGRRLAS